MDDYMIYCCICGLREGVNVVSDWRSRVCDVCADKLIKGENDDNSKSKV